MVGKKIPTRVYFIALGLLLTGAGTYVDWDVQTVLNLEYMLNPQFSGSKDLEEAQQIQANKAFKTLHSSIKEKSEAQSEFKGKLSDEPKFRKRDEKRWDKYQKDYEKNWPSYEKAIDKHLEACETAQNLDSQNGIFMAVAAQAKFEKAIYPSAHYGLGRQETEIPFWNKVKVVDSEALMDALETLETSLTFPEFTFRTDQQILNRLERLENTSGIEGLISRATAVFTCDVANLLDARQMCNILVILSEKRSPLSEADKRRVLRAGRQFALRWGDSSVFLIELMIARACLQIIDNAWLEFAAERSDVKEVRAVSEEIYELNKNTEVGAMLDFESSRLGMLDWLSMPSGGWSAPNFDPNLGRMMDYSVVESLILWLFLTVTLLLLVESWVSTKFYKVGEGELKAQGWTFGDVLHVTLPSFMASAVFLILLMRFHPAREFGLSRGDNFLGVACQALMLIGFAAVSYEVLLRRRALGKFGIPLYSPKRLKLALVSTVLALYLGTSWVGPFNTFAVWPAFAILAFALGAAWTGLGHRRLDKDQKRVFMHYRSRVSMASLGFVTCLLPVLIMGVSMPHRNSMVDAYTQQQIPLWQAEAVHWGRGELKKQFRETSKYAYDHPITKEDLRALKKAEKKKKR